MDHCIYPVNLRNFQTRVDFIGCGFVGEDGSAFTLTEPSKLYIYDTGDSNAEICFTNTTINGCTGNAILTGTNLRLTGCRIYDYGTDSTATNIRNGIQLLSGNHDIVINNSTITATAGGYTRCVYDGGYDGNNLIVTGGSKLTGSTVEIFRWNGGASNREAISNDSILTGSSSSINARGSISFYTPHLEYSATAMPTAGTFTKGEYVKNTTRTILGATGNKYIIVGWARITDGSAHVLNTDWVEVRAPTGQ